MKKSLLILLFFAVTSCSQGISDMHDDLLQKVPICVDTVHGTASPADGRGRGWKNAYSSIQNAVDAAQPGDEIWVMGETIISSTILINNKNKILFYGGFNGTESHLWQRNLNNKTKISGSISGIPISINISHDIFIDGFSISDLTSVMSGIYIGNGSSVTISNCYFNKITVTSDNGSCISLNNSTLNIIDTEFTGNKTTAGDGGAIYVYADCTITITSSLFDSNTASADGGAIALIGNATQKPNISISKSYFYRNKAGGSGGAISAYLANEVIITDCTFGGVGLENTAVLPGGALALSSNSKQIVIKNCAIINNSANYGGGIFSDNCLITISGGAIRNNYASLSGGGIYAKGTSIVDLIGCTIAGNTMNNYLAVDAATINEH